MWLSEYLSFNVAPKHLKANAEGWVLVLVLNIVDALRTISSTSDYVLKGMNKM